MYDVYAADRAAVEQDIEAALRLLHRWGAERVYPHMLIPHLPYYRAAQTLRRDLRRMTAEGRCMRLGERRGYRLVA